MSGASGGRNPRLTPEQTPLSFSSKAVLTRPLNTFMLCEKCRQRDATVHLSGSRKVETVSGQTSANESFEHHLCEPCASRSPLANPALGYGPDAISEKLRVIAVSSEHTRVNLLRTESDAVPEEWILVTSHLPSHYTTVGT